VTYAICFSGQPRVYDQAWANHSHHVLNDRFTSYVHCWWHHSDAGKTKMFHSTERYADDPSLGQKYAALYNSDASVIEPIVAFDLSFCKSHDRATWENVPQVHLDIFTPGLLQSHLSQFYSVRQSIRLSEARSHELVIRMRPDVVFTRDVRSVLDVIKPKDDEIYFQSSCGGGHIYSGEFPNNACDWFFCGTQAAMSKFSLRLDPDYREICSTGVKHNRNFMRQIAENAGLKIVLVDFGAVMHRQLVKNDSFRPVQMYYDDFDSQTLSIKQNLDSWPHWHDKIDFKFLRNRGL